MKYKALVDPTNKPFGNLLPLQLQVIIMFWTQCFLTNDRRKKMDACAESTWQDTLCCAVFANEAMKYKGLVDPKDKPFGNLLPFEVQVIIMFWTQCFMTNDRRKKMNAEFTRLPSYLGTDIPKLMALSFSSSYKSFSSAMENKPYPRFYGCPHCLRRNTQQVSVSMFINFPSLLFHAYH